MFQIRFLCIRRISVLERRVDSLEAPCKRRSLPTYAIARSFFLFHFDFSNSIIAWRITDRGVDSWDSCGEAGPCDCAYLRRAVNCWEKLGGRYKAEA